MPETLKTIIVNTSINGRAYKATIEPRLTLADFLRHEVNLKGTHLGCEHGVCGACTVLLDGLSARSCLILAVQAEGIEINTVESLESNGELGILQESFWEEHGLQCGFCTPGILMSLTELLRNNQNPAEVEIRSVLSGHLCRCTGYQNIVTATLAAAEKLKRNKT
ncbi:MAG: (2Fe-2S)-binding protein [Betaproteobacteria bacterium]|nr:(2Fe-2S)-binding protein [Betaproteobacteria bacterium]